MSSLRIFREGGLHDAEKSGYFKNIVTGCPIAPGVELYPFFFTIMPIGIPCIPLTAFKLEGIGAGGEVVVTYSLDTDLISITSNGTNYIAEYDATTDVLTPLGSYSNGVYRYKIEFGTTIFYSEYYIVNSQRYISVIGVGDFDLDDFDEDFY